ncbi:chain-length determining protein [Paraglaciecola agarilytica]|uniref:XrtA system polysaccharide chain length determinant n=1 Tax=Paraglaciecola chathamensis TaxID=368405 RepID=UPI001C0841CD|nr:MULTISPECIES: XrtA system polysaccharide chain length determinant [Paraglaciecola]MBU3017163.1 chain-length determining protein [Paraglaciecola agarilytica]MDO6558265.1 Wzz/FepE/Etk N-terminal domain-containing protein [Paraglaciecola chathamensis]MDO6838874.1 Wzz/FepE/Etk N-terminal domain-containing protein [Paraglaciecola chathamensis]
MQDLQKTLELLLDYLRGVWVKKRYVMICSWLICPIGFVYVASLPDVYQSQARVYVDTRSVLQPLLRGLAIQTNPQQEISMMVKTLLSRPNLEVIARESDLDVTALTPEDYEDIISELSSNISLRSAGQDNLYTIAYTDSDPQMAKTVVQETLDLFVEGALGSSRKDSDSASRFIEEQITDYENRLSSAEQRVADFQRKYSSLLPEKGNFYQNYTELNAQLEQTILSIKETEHQIKALSGELRGSNSQVDSFAVKPSDADSILTTRYDARIESLEEKLDELSLRYTDLHPDVIETKNLLEALQKSRQEEIDEYLSNSSSEDPSNSLGGLSKEIRIEVSRLQSLIASLNVRKDDFESKIEELKQKIDLVPQVEAEFTALNRDYGITKRKYEELLSRRESADLAQKADVSSEDVQFRVIDPPLAPLAPTGPNRLIGYTAVVFVGFAAGLGIAFLISQLNPILIRGSQLTSLTTYPVLGVVSHLNVKEIRTVNRTRILVFMFSSGLILMLYGALVATEIMNIDVLSRVLA